MPQPRKHASAAQRQAAYLQRQRSAVVEQLTQKGLVPLPALSTIPGQTRWRQALSQAQWLIETVSGEMQDYHDDRSESWQESEKAESFLERLDQVQSISEQLSELL